MAAQTHRIPAASIRQTALCPELLDLQSRYEIWMLTARGLAQSTIVTRMSYFRQLTAAIGLAPTHDDVRRYIAEFRKSGASYAHTYCAIVCAECFLDFLGNPLRLGRPRTPRLLAKEGLTESEIAMVIHHCRDLRERAIIATLAYSGVRNKEFCGLRIKDIDVATCLVSVHSAKGGQNYRPAITADCARLLGQYILFRTQQQAATPDDWMFVTCRHGYQLEQQDLRKIIREAVRRAGIKKHVSPHLFRHSLAMNMLNRGASILTIQHQLGHAWIQTTMSYLRGDYTRGQHEYPLTAPSYL